MLKLFDIICAIWNTKVKNVYSLYMMSYEVLELLIFYKVLTEQHVIFCWRGTTFTPHSSKVEGSCSTSEWGGFGFGFGFVSDKLPGNLTSYVTLDKPDSFPNFC